MRRPRLAAGVNHMMDIGRYILVSLEVNQTVNQLERGGGGWRGEKGGRGEREGGEERERERGGERERGERK